MIMDVQKKPLTTIGWTCTKMIVDTSQSRRTLNYGLGLERLGPSQELVPGSPSRGNRNLVLLNLYTRDSRGLEWTLIMVSIKGTLKSPTVFGQVGGGEGQVKEVRG